MDATDLGYTFQTCPYDKSHRILKSRLTAHLVHCRQNNPRLKRRNAKVCPYDFYHVVEAADYESHVETCLKRPKVFEDIDVIDDQFHIGSVPLEELKKVFVPPAKENWGEDPPAQTYDPLQQAKNRSVLLAPVGLSTAKKRAFRKAERQRFISLEGKSGRADKFPKPMKEKPYKPTMKDDYKYLTKKTSGDVNKYDRFPVSDDDDEEPEFRLRPPRTRSLALTMRCNSIYQDDVLNTSNMSNMEKDLTKIFS
ncbi:gametocyte-specific factor 1 homolog isoform X2 [Belonocnema kinseyi]|nr:gametocyte-specific factor 1 homolog isoform X2 [Belonocnema kinseyi]